MPEGLRLPLAVLRRRVEPRSVVGEVLLDDLRVGDVVVVDGRVVVDLEAEARDSDVVVAGSVRATWEGTCRRCLTELGGEVDLAVREVLSEKADPTSVSGPDGDVYPLGFDEADVEPVVRDAVLLALPLSPLCGEGCGGPDPERFPTGPAAPDRTDEAAEPSGDPLWAALDALRTDPDEGKS